MSIIAYIINKFVYIVEGIVSFNDVFCTFIILLAVFSFKMFHKDVQKNVRDIQSFIHKSENITGDLPNRLKIVKDEDFFNGNEFLTNEWDSYISYAAIGNILFTVDGVLDYTDLKLNGEMKNIALGTEEIPIFDTVTLEVI